MKKETLKERIDRLLQIYDEFWGIQSVETITENTKKCRQHWLMEELRKERDYGKA